MPYTPPSHRSPASSQPNSPIVNHSHSYGGACVSLQSTSAAHRPVLPPVCSTSYLSRHRRTPSISQTPPDGHQDSVAPANGAESTPPDSVQNSDDEDRGRQSGTLAELQHALQSIELQRGHSPERCANGTDPAAPQPVQPDAPARPALTPEARKISHSRSSSEMHLSKHVASLGTSPAQSSDDSDYEENLTMKPPLLRKKSGELVKPALRPPSSRARRRPSSMPGTPSFSKAVHFNDDIEQVRHFLQVDRPIAVSAGSSPVESYESESEYPFGKDEAGGAYAPPRRSRVEWELRLANFPRESFERKTMPVRVEKIVLSSDNTTLVGTVAVANLAFHKLVVARFTLDCWKTTSEVVAEFTDDVPRGQATDGCDRFVFNIKLADQANLETKTMLLCVRYNVGGAEHWDNNGAANFQIDFVKKTLPKRSWGKRCSSVGTFAAIPRSRHSPPAPRPRHTSSVSADDDFGGNFDSSKYTFGSGTDESLHAPIRLKSKPRPQKRNSAPDQAGSILPPSAQKAFSTRYDFTTSLSRALNNARTVLGDHSGIKRNPIGSRTSDYFSLQGDAPALTDSTEPRPDQLSSEKPDLKSAEYNELIQKYCFFGSVKGSPRHVSAPAPVVTSNATGSNDSDGCTFSPSPPKEVPSSMDGAMDEKALARAASPFLSRSASPSPVTGSDFGDRTASPVSFGYPFNMHGGISFETHTPTAILG